MKFVEITIPRNENDPGLPNDLLINLNEIVEIFVRTLYPEESDVRGHKYGLFITQRSREIRLHGTKEQCEHGYKDLRVILDRAPIDSERNGIVGTFTFPGIFPDEV